MSRAKWNPFEQVVHKFVGTRGAQSLYAGSDQIHQEETSSNFGQVFPKEPASFLKEIASKRLVFLGEIHSIPPIVALQKAVQEKMAEESSLLHVVFEHFSFEMQPLLDDYQDGKINFDQMVERYRQIGTENHNLEPYRSLLEHAKADKKKIRLHAGFLSRSFSRMLMKEGETVALEAASEWLPPNPILEGHEFHYNLFESLISGRFLYHSDGGPPSDRFRGMYKAQLLKDVAMANKVNQLLENSSDESEKILVVAGNGHLLHYCGVPERVLSANPYLANQTSLVVSHPSNANLDDDSSIMRDVTDSFGPKGTNPADYLYLYKDDNDQEQIDAAVRAETKNAYDKVGESAHFQGNMKKAKVMMDSLGYTQEQFDIAGPDAYNYQGVGNPHLHAGIQPGDFVLDVGSGLGVDSFIAEEYAGKDGQVIGIDISNKEVKHSQQRAIDRGSSTCFAAADMESLPLPDDSFDVVISNGAFCLAPNKEKAFAEILRVLKPGGRISICTSTTKEANLEAGVNWPLCMKMFIPIEDIVPVCEKLGYVDVFVDDSDSLMTMELPEEVLEDTNPNRSKIHVGSEEFKHLEEYDMNKLCARVCVVARKPK